MSPLTLASPSKGRSDPTEQARSPPETQGCSFQCGSETGPGAPAPDQRKHSYYPRRRAVAARRAGAWPARCQVEVKKKVTQFLLLRECKQHHKGEREVLQISEPAT